MEVDQRSDDFRPMTYRERLLRLRSQNVVAADHDVKADTETKLPRIVLKDSLGNRLNTFTLLQEALYRAEWNVKQSKESKLPEEWRLPGAPLPARPDYSRATPSAFTPRLPQPQKKNDDGKVTSKSSSSGKRFYEIDIDDVSFVKESLNHLPQVPSLAFLRQEFLRDRKDYLQIVGSILLHKRFLSETDKREAIYNFPGFCTGCQRSGLCYGCERSSEPHYHVDGLKLGEAYQLNTNRGIGFLNEDRFTDNWRLRFPELTRRSRGRDGSKIPHDSQLFGEDSRGGRKGFAIISDEKLPDLPGLGPFKYDNDDQGSSEKDPDRMDIYNQQDLLSDLDKLSRHGTLSGEGQRGKGGTGRQGGQEGSEALQGDKTGEKILRLGTAGQDVDRESDEEERDRDNDKSTSVSSSQKRDYDKDSSTRREKSDMSSGHYSQHTSRWASGTEGYEEDDDEEDYTQRDSETTSSAQKRRRLYKVHHVPSAERRDSSESPAPFKLKQRKQRATQSRSPFSTNRKYDVPSGKPWSPKKSNKKLTEFAEFERKEGDWKEPKKFTIKHSDKGTTQFWSPPPGKDKDVKKKKTRRKVQGPPPSPDSGLESEKVHAKTDTPRIRKHLPKQNFTMRLPTIPSPNPSSNTPSNISLSPILSISREASLDPAIRYRLPSPKVSAKVTSQEKGKRNNVDRKNKNNTPVRDVVTGKDSDILKNDNEKEKESLVRKGGKLMQEGKDLPPGVLEMDDENDNLTLIKDSTVKKSPAHYEGSETSVKRMIELQPEDDVNILHVTGGTKGTPLPQRDVPSRHEVLSTNDDIESLIISKYSDIDSSPTAVEQYGRNLSTRGSTRASVNSVEDVWPSLMEHSTDNKGYQLKKKIQNPNDAGRSARYFKKNDGKIPRSFQENLTNTTMKGSRSPMKKNRIGHSSLEKLKEVDEKDGKEQFSSYGEPHLMKRNGNDDNLRKVKKSLSPTKSRKSRSIDSKSNTGMISREECRQSLSRNDNHHHQKGRMSRTPKNGDKLVVKEHKKSKSQSKTKHGKSLGKQKANLDRGKTALTESQESDSSTEYDSDRERRPSSSDDTNDYSRVYHRSKSVNERRSRIDQFLMESGKLGMEYQEYDYYKQVTRSKLLKKEDITTKTEDNVQTDKPLDSRNETNLAHKTIDNSRMVDSKAVLNKSKDVETSSRYILSSNRTSENEDQARPLFFRTTSNGDISKRNNVSEGSSRHIEKQKEESLARSILSSNRTPERQHLFIRTASNGDIKKGKKVVEGSSASRPITSLNRELVREESDVSRPIVLRTTSGAISPIYYEPTFVRCPWADSDDEEELKLDRVSNVSLPKREINIHIPKVDMSRRNSEILTDIKQSTVRNTADKLNKALEDYLSVKKKSLASSEGSGSVPVASVENVSLTSAEPDLELSFSDILDLEKLPEYDDLYEHQLRRKLRRQKKMTNAGIQKVKKDDVKDFDEERLSNSNEIAEGKESAFDMGKTKAKEEESDYTRGNNERKDINHSSPISIDTLKKGHVKFGNPDEITDTKHPSTVPTDTVRKDDEAVDGHGKTRYANVATKDESAHRFSKEYLSLKSEGLGSVGIAHTSPKGSKDKKQTRTMSREQLDSKFSRFGNADTNHNSNKGRDPSRSVSREQLKSNSSRSGNAQDRKRKMKKPGRQLKGSSLKERLHEKREKLTKEISEIDFNDLPSIQSTLKKIMYVDPKLVERGQGYSDKPQRNEDKHNLTDSDTELDPSDVEFPEEFQTIPVINLEFHDEDGDHLGEETNKNILQRPRSASTESCYEKIDRKMLLRRASSLPIIALKAEQIVDKKEEPICTPVFLPKFPARFRPKKTKTLNPKRVPGRQRPISQEQTTSNSPDAESNQNIESEITVENDEQSPFPDVLDVDEDDDDGNDKDGGEDDDKEIVLDVPHPSPSTPMNEHGIEIAEKEEIIDSVKEIPLKTSDLTDLERTSSPLSPRGGSPAQRLGDLPSKRPVGISPIVEKPQKKEKVKKPKKEVKKPPTPIRSCSPHTPIPLDEEPVVALETQKIDVAPPALPELPPLELPPLPEYVEDKEKKDKKKVPHRVSIEPMPKLQDQAPPPSKKSKPLQVPRSKPLLRKKSLAEAPVTVDEISHMKDPLDFLAKYCIISLDRLPYYEKVYNRVVASQPQRYEPPLSPISGMPLQPTKRREKKKEKGEVTLHDMVSVTRGMEPFKVGLNVPEQYVEKLIYTIQICDEKHLDISERLRELEIQKTILLAERAKQLNPDIAKVEFKLKKSKKKKKKKKSGAVEVEEPIVFSKKDITDEVIVARIDEKMMKKLMKEPDLHHIQCDMERCADRLATLEFRILQMENERNILDMYCTDLFFTEQLANERPVEFRRQQSNLFNKLHPDPDIEMNIEELERALHTINSTLLTESEFGYLFHVLNLAGRRKINFKLFSVIAALSEKISQMDPVIKDLLNKDDYNALDIKMERSKELFGLLDDGDTAMYGNALASNLAVELTAGGLTPEHTSYVISKFNREGKGFIDFLDYVMYVPLFIEIHERIISDPLNAKLVI